jgi:hypothetical protein
LNPARTELKILLLSKVIAKKLILGVGCKVLGLFNYEELKALSVVPGKNALAIRRVVIYDFVFFENLHTLKIFYPFVLNTLF